MGYIDDMISFKLTIMKTITVYCSLNQNIYKVYYSSYLGKSGSTLWITLYSK